MGRAVRMRRLILLLLFSLALAIPSLAQELPINFEFKRETGQETGVPLFILIPRTEAMEYDANRGSTFEGLGMLTQPERDKYGLVFFNAKADYQLSTQKEKGVMLQIDGEDFKIPEYKIVNQAIVGRLKIESSAIAIDKKIYEKLVKANDITIRVGIVIYNLDQDNIDALHYYGAQVEKDITRRTRRSPKKRA
jgi:hypothetical protein